jgi:phosphoenolpyruvate carboxylase
MKNTNTTSTHQTENINSPHIIPGNKPAGLLNTASTDKQLRSKVKLLGTLLGNVLLANAGAKVYDAVEKLRVGFIELHKEEDAEKRAHLMTLIASLDEETLTQVVRAFSTYFSLVNVAEEASQLQLRRRQIRDVIRLKPNAAVFYMPYAEYF